MVEIMNLWKSVVFVLLFAVVSSCGEQEPGGKFRKEGVSFIYPSGWSITKQKEINGSGYLLSIQKAGFQASGLVTLTWVNKVIDERVYVGLLQKEYVNQKVLKNIKFQPTRERSFNGIKSVSCGFNFNVLGVKHRGEIFVFVKGEKTYSIIKQEALKDISTNKEGFERIESTFKVK